MSEECPICLQSLLYPVELPCDHKFCFLCIKGIRSNTSAVKTCAMCRQPFSSEQLEQSLGIEKKCLESKAKKLKWYYEGRNNGYWAFDEKSNLELERAYSERKEEKIVISIAGFNYCIDFTKLIQFPVHHPTRIRKIKRTEELSSDFKIKGIAGLRVSEREHTGEVTDRSSQRDNNASQSTDDLPSSMSEQLSQTLAESLHVSDEH